MVHGLGNGKYLAMAMVTTVVFVSHSAHFSVCVKSVFFKKMIYWVAFDACLSCLEKDEYME
jgi:hypothetical protein